jgi:outer membrane protein OmpA-like peptidoglycan-associated protein
LAQEQKKIDVEELTCSLSPSCGVQSELLEADEPAGDEADAEPTMDVGPTKAFKLSRIDKPSISAAQAQTSPRFEGQKSRGAQLRKPRQAKRPKLHHAAAVKRRGEARANLYLTFERSSDQLTPSARENAELVAKALLSPKLADKKFRIEGHTDSTGSRELNVDLSQRRARAVAEFLTRQGVQPDRLEVQGFGPDRPLKGRPATSGENRRVEAVLIS